MLSLQCFRDIRLEMWHHQLDIKGLELSREKRLHLSMGSHSRTHSKWSWRCGLDCLWSRVGRRQGVGGTLWDGQYYLVGLTGGSHELVHANGLQHCQCLINDRWYYKLDLRDVCSRTDSSSKEWKREFWNRSCMLMIITTDNILCELAVLSTLHVLHHLILITTLKVGNIFILVLQMRKAEVHTGQVDLFKVPHVLIPPSHTVAGQWWRTQTRAVG